MRLARFAFVVAVLSFTTLAFAQESEFQGKIQEDMDGYKSQVVGHCGMPASLTIKYSGKLGSNPRETKKGNYGSVSTLCTSALEGLAQVCNNEVVKKSMVKLTSVTCQPGKGTMSYALKGTNITFSVDPVYAANNASTQENDMMEKMKADLDK